MLILCRLLGTHVTGIIGALANEYGFSGTLFLRGSYLGALVERSLLCIGVAPQAELGQYRVIGCEGFTSEDVVRLLRSFCVSSCVSDHSFTRL
jgi:hypothetical protein